MVTDSYLVRSAPETQGISSAAILAFVDAAEEQIDALHSLMLLRHGHVVAEGWWSPYAQHEPHMLFSLSKSFTSTAVGLAVAEGRLSIHDHVLSFFPDDAPAEVSPPLAAMQVRHLLSMSTGHTEDTTCALHEAVDGNWAKAFLAQPVEREPGSHFLYNSGATYMLSAIIQRLTGQTLLGYLQPRLFAPLGIADATWESCPRGVNVGGWGLKITTEAIARFGQLYLQQGVWDGRQLVPADWVAEATAKQVNNGSNPQSDWEQGYCYQFWCSQHGAYRGDGAFGQFCVVMPEQDAVLAITGGVADMQSVLNLVWEHLLPALQPGELPANSLGHEKLQQRLNTLALPPQAGASSSPLAKKVSGWRYRFDLNDQLGGDNALPRLKAITLDFAEVGATITLDDSFGEQRIPCGYGEWMRGSLVVDGRGVQPVAISGGWTTENTFVVKQYFYQTPFCNTTTLQFGADRLTYQARVNVSFGPTELPLLVGRIDE